MSFESKWKTLRGKCPQLQWSSSESKTEACFRGEEHLQRRKWHPKKGKRIHLPLDKETVCLDQKRLDLFESQTWGCKRWPVEFMGTSVTARISWEWEGTWFAFNLLEWEKMYRNQTVTDSDPKADPSGWTESLPIGLRPRKSGRRNVVNPSPPKVLPIKLCKPKYWEMRSVFPSQNRWSLGAKFPANRRICPKNWASARLNRKNPKSSEKESTCIAFKVEKWEWRLAWSLGKSSIVFWTWEEAQRFSSSPRHLSLWRLEFPFETFRFSQSYESTRHDILISFLG